MQKHLAFAAMISTAVALLGGCDAPTGGCLHPPAQGHSEPCCESLGVDACAVGLVCAALDGRTTASCFFEFTRADGQSCTADNHCLSMSCNTDVEACRSSALTCTREIGCAPIVGSSARRACSFEELPGEFRCLNVGSGAPGEPCVDAADCTGESSCGDDGRCEPVPYRQSLCSYPVSSRPPDDICPTSDGSRHTCARVEDVDGTRYGICGLPCGSFGECPEGFVCNGNCAPRCETAADCLNPELGCRPSRSTGELGCAVCNASDQCRPGQTCVIDPGRVEGTCR